MPANIPTHAVNDGPAIRATDLNRHYKMGESLVRALDGVTLEIAAGDFVALLLLGGRALWRTMRPSGRLDDSQETPKRGRPSWLRTPGWLRRPTLRLPRLRMPKWRLPKWRRPQLRRPGWLCISGGNTENLRPRPKLQCARKVILNRRKHHEQ